MRQILAKRGANSKFVVEANHKPKLKPNFEVVIQILFEANFNPCFSKVFDPK